MTASYTIAVRALCEFSARRGDLDWRFTPAPSAREGVTGHQRVTARRGPRYQREVALQGSWEELQVRGRADGYDPDRNCLEEIKTHRGDLALQPDNHRQLHWAQARIYGFLMCQDRGLDDIELALVYYDVGSDSETRLCEHHAADELRAFFEQQCQLFLHWARQELAHRQARDHWLEQLDFPRPEFRRGQRTLAEAVYRAAATGSTLLAQAPTGIGKTLGTLFPMLRAMPRQGIDRLLFLSARTPGRALGLAALRQLLANDDGVPLRVLERVARDKACEYPGRACHGGDCPLARGFYDRLPVARNQAVAYSLLDQARVREVALANEVCPYYLGQELSLWSDVQVGDYNHYFDVDAGLYGLARSRDWRVALLVDEAHNLVERGREMYSARLDQRQWRALARNQSAPLKRALSNALRQWSRLNGDALGRDDSGAKPGANPTHAVLETALPGALMSAFQRLIAALSDHFSENRRDIDPDLQTLHFSLLHFCQLAERFDQHSFYLLEIIPGSRGATTLSLRNAIPGPFLGPRLQQARSSVLFSATLSPPGYYRDLLGLPGNTPWIEIDGPFHSAQLAVRIHRNISTRYRDRQASLQPIIELITQRFRQAPGNYLAFFSSFEYLGQVLSLLRQAHADLPCWEQTRDMDEDARHTFLQRFVPGGQGIGFAVLGGAFAEGIDLPGQRLIGVFVATLGLPQLNPLNEQLRRRLQMQFGRGYDYAYLYPGLRKVTQAAGRVLRSESDRGSLDLIDDRFDTPAVRALLPAWWQPG